MLSIVREAIFNGKLPASKEESFYDKKLKMFYTPYPVKKIDELTLRLFGSKVTRKNYKYIDINVYSAIYKKGTFYLIDPDYGSSPELDIPQVNSLQALGNNLFYVKFVIYSVDQFENPKKFLIPRETWTSKEKSIAYKGTKGYAIVKKVKVDSGKNIWRLQRFNENGSLSKKQLNAFLE